MSRKNIKSDGSNAKPEHTNEDEEPTQFARVLQAVHDTQQTHGCTIEEIVAQLQSSSSTSKTDGELLCRQVRRALWQAIEVHFIGQCEGRFQILTSRQAAQARRKSRRRKENGKRGKRRRSPTTDTDTDTTCESVASTTDFSISNDKEKRNTRHRSHRTRRRRRRRETKQKRKSKERRKSSISNRNRGHSEEKKTEPPPEKSPPDEDKNNQQQQQQQNDCLLDRPSSITAERHRHTHKSNRGWGRHLMDEAPERDDPDRPCELREESLEPREPPEPSLDQE